MNLHMAVSDGNDAVDGEWRLLASLLWLDLMVDFKFFLMMANL